MADNTSTNQVHRRGFDSPAATWVSRVLGGFLVGAGVGMALEMLRHDTIRAGGVYAPVVLVGGLWFVALAYRPASASE